MDDEPTFLEMYKTKFEAGGFAVLTCGETGNALETIVAFMPDVIFLDLVMKNADGLSILKALKSDIRTKWIPVVMLSNIDNPTDKEQCEAAGASQFLVKSNFTPGDLLDYAKNLLKVIGRPSSAG